MWHTVLGHYDLNILRQVNLSDYNDTIAWWIPASKAIDKNRRREFNGVATYIMWNIWKERNRRIFQAVAAPAFVVAMMACDAIDSHKLDFSPLTA